jgi:hypothetical protein
MICTAASQTRYSRFDVFDGSIRFLPVANISAANAGAHRREREFATDDGAGVQVIVASVIAQRIEHHMAFGVARERQGAALFEQRLEADFVAGLVGDVQLVVHVLTFRLVAASPQ